MKDAFIIDTTIPEPGGLGINAFPQLVAIVGESTWQLMKAKKALKVNYESVSEAENSEMHAAKMEADFEKGQAATSRLDGDPDAALLVLPRS